MLSSIHLDPWHDPQSLLLLSDSYKYSHWNQYAPNTTEVYSYLCSRGGQFDEVMLVGLQEILLKHFVGRVITKDDLFIGRMVAKEHLGRPELFDEPMWQHIIDKHEGKLPLEIKAVPEGLPIPTHNLMLSVRNTDPKCFALTSFVEGLLLHVWASSTIGTLSREIKKIILAALIKTGTPEDIAYKLNDFGYRGVSSNESCSYGSMAHLVNFKGTDGLLGLEAARKYYGSSYAETGHSIAATEHSTITSWGREHEVDAYRNFLKNNPTGLIACVSDSYDIFKACSDLWGGILRHEVMARQGTLVIRPDSGEPIPTILKCLDILTEKFGSSVNSKGYKVLPPQVRLIQGDGVNIFSIGGILAAMEAAGYSADNIAFGCGGGLLQSVTRDTQRFAFKCSSIIVDGKPRDVYKQPIGDPGKNSLKGKLVLVKRGAEGSYLTIRKDEMIWPDEDLLQTIFLDGELKKRYTLSDLRENAKIVV
jgi:nicotinamide phosphoribosyltransferase